MIQKFIIFLFISLSLISNAKAEVELESFFNKADLFLKQIVHNGLVDYRTVKNNPDILNELISDISKIEFDNLQSGNQEKAYLVNVYNLLVIKSVIKKYPLNSVMDIAGFFDTDIINIEGNALSLNEIEKEILFKKYPDPRLHFVLVCAAIGCPQIINTAYFPDQLEKQLDERTEITLNNVRHVRTDLSNKTVYISELFNWYKNDFTNENFTIIDYINKYRENKIPNNYKIKYIPYDWKLNVRKKNQKSLKMKDTTNLQAYTPSTLLKPGQIEIKLFNNLYTQTAYFDGTSKKKVLNKRESYFTGIINSLYGLSPDFNIGMDMYIKSVRMDEESSSPFSIFKFSNDNNSRTAIAQIGPKLKISPFKSVRNLAIQSTFLFALNSDLDGSQNLNTPYLDVDGSQWWTQFFYDITIDTEFLLYFETGFFFRLGADNQNLYTPLKSFINYYPSNEWTIYLPIEFTGFWQDSSIAAYYNQTGIGAKYQLNYNFELEVLVTKFILGKSQGAGDTYNLGMRIII